MDWKFEKNMYPILDTRVGSYFVSATASHYDWAMKKIKAHQKNCKSK
ncbi:ClbS/DfsB family four-helix bundle protein [Lachnoanaerobaculum orale]|nr:ClbS/DfsB family four-helix bundle protein [Lachnoanaerobaculum orale]